MVVLFGTLGFHPEKFLSAVPGVGQSVERVVVYAAAQTEPEARRRTESALGAVLETLRQMGVPSEFRELRGPWAYGDILRTLLRDLQDHRPEDMVFNLTGGPKTMTVAASMACLLLGIRVVYVPEELEGPGRPVELPLLRIRYSQVLTPVQQRILRVIRDATPPTLTDLARRLRRREATVSYHVENLEGLGAIRVEPAQDRRAARPVLTEAGEIMLLAEETLGQRETQE